MYTVPPNPHVPALPAGESMPAGSLVATGGYVLVCHHVRLVVDALSGGVVWWGMPRNKKDTILVDWIQNEVGSGKSHEMERLNPHLKKKYHSATLLYRFVENEGAGCENERSRFCEP